MIKVSSHFKGLGNNAFLTFIKALLNTLMASTFFSAEVKSKSKALQSNAAKLETTLTKSARTPGDAVASDRESVTLELLRLINILELELSYANVPEQESIAILGELGLKTKGKRNSKQREFHARAGETQGSVVLIAAGNADINEWWYSSDVKDHTNAVYLSPTTAAMTEVQGLASGTYAFFHRALRKNEAVKVEGPVLFVVG